MCSIVATFAVPTLSDPCLSSFLIGLSFCPHPGHYHLHVQKAVSPTLSHSLIGPLRLLHHAFASAHIVPQPLLLGRAFPSLRVSAAPVLRCRALLSPRRAVLCAGGRALTRGASGARYLWLAVRPLRFTALLRPHVLHSPAAVGRRPSVGQLSADPGGVSWLARKRQWNECIALESKRRCCFLRTPWASFCVRSVVFFSGPCPVGELHLWWAFG